jgi:hypothetical protein
MFSKPLFDEVNQKYNKFIIIYNKNCKKNHFSNKLPIKPNTMIQLILLFSLIYKSENKSK